MKKILFFLFVATLSLAGAKDLAFQAIDPLQGSPEHYYNDALTSETQGNVVEASLALRRALILNPRLTLAQEHLDALLKKMDLPHEGLWQAQLSARCSPETLVWVGSLVGWSAALFFIGMLFVALGASASSKKKRYWPFVIVLLFFFLGHAAAFLGTMIDPRMRAQHEVMLIPKNNAADQEEAQPAAPHGTPLRSAPADNASILVELPPGTCLILLSQHGPWSYVKTPSGQSGWISSTILEPLIPNGLVEGLALHSSLFIC